MAADRFSLDIGPDPAAVAFLAGKGVERSWRWPTLWREQHSAAFTLAGVWRLDVIAAAQELTTQAVRDGETFAQFQTNFAERLSKLGFAGRQTVTEFAEGPRRVNLTAPWRTRVIYDTNVRQAYAASEWAAIEQTKADFPALQYQGVRDERTRASHARWFGIVLPVDHVFWRTHYPPNDWYCRCYVIQISVDELADGAAKLTTEADLAETGYSSDPEEWPEWRHAQTGRTSRTPPGVGPGFAYNAGQVRRANLAELLGRRIESLPPPLAKAASADLAALPQFGALVEDAVALGQSRAASRSAEAARLLASGVRRDEAERLAREKADAEQPFPTASWPLAVAPEEPPFEGARLVVVNASAIGHSADQHPTRPADWDRVRQLVDDGEIWQSARGELTIVGRFRSADGEQLWALGLKRTDGAWRVRTLFPTSPRRRARFAKDRTMVRAGRGGFAP